MALNVNRNVQDAFYRYKMPRLVAKVEGKGNGVKTVIPNMTEIARALGRPPTYCTKYFGCELGAQTQFDFKNERYIVNGSHDAAKLQDLLDGFIKKFVLCAQCENPETVFKVNSKRGVITSSCKACGHSFQIDMRHKLTTFILKNPPGQQMNSHGTSLTKKKDKKSKRKEDDDGKDEEETATNGNGGSPGGDQANDDDWGDDDGDWCEDVSEEAVKQRQKELTSGIQGLTMDNDLEKTETERANIFHDFVKAKIEDGSLDNSAKEVLMEAERLEVTNKAPLILCELLFSDTMVSQIKKNKRLLLRFTHEKPKAQKYLMGGFEKTVEAHKSALMAKVPVILKTFYDEDIIDEEVILEWAKKVSKKYISKALSEEIHKKAEPFITWLKEAEEESSDDDEENVELTFDERAKISTLREQKDEDEEPEENNKATSQKDANGEDDEEDLDIDDI